MKFARVALPMLLLALATPLSAQWLGRVDSAALQRILIAEDLRGTGIDSTAPLIAGVHSPDSLLRRVAARALGRLQRPGFARDVAHLLRDSVPAVRAAAAEAISQSMARARRRVNDSLQSDVKWAATVLEAALATEKNHAVASQLADALGRMPYGDTATAQVALRAILASKVVAFGSLRGLYWLALNRTTTGGLSTEAIDVLRAAIQPTEPVMKAPPTGVRPLGTFTESRRVAALALNVLKALDSSSTALLLRDKDEQLRRMALGGLRGLSPSYRTIVLNAALADPSPIVRVAAIDSLRVVDRRPTCTPIINALKDPHPYVVQTAIDALALPCADSSAAVTALASVFDETKPMHATWAESNHALVSLGKLGKTNLFQFYAKSQASQLQIGIADGAAALGDTTTLLMYAVAAADHNVRESAITGLSKAVKHRGDTIYVAALASPGYQVVRAAALALAGTQYAPALPALLDNLDRITKEKRENSRDPRVAILQRVGELGSSANVGRLTPYLADFDTTVAQGAAQILSKWTATAVAAHAVPLKVPVEPLAKIFLARDVQLRVTMASGKVFTVKLFTEESPATAARIVKLAQAHFYDLHAFQRVEPNFVVQGGGPDASEYVGDAQFMRDEISPRSHLRGTLGISSRGRDTGDAQWFFNLTDNTRLDHEYTVFGEVTTGRDVVERIVDGELIRSVTVVGWP